MIGAILTATRLGLAALSGTDALVEASAKFGLRLAARSHGKNRDAADEMAELMRERVPVDKGRLLNGITVEEEGDAVTVTASAIRGDFDYARALEFGHDVGHATAALYDDTTGLGHRKSRAQHGNHAEAEPYFVDSAREVLERRGVAMEDVVLPAVEEAGL